MFDKKFIVSMRDEKGNRRDVPVTVQLRCKICGAPTRSHVTEDGVFCHDCWECRGLENPEVRKRIGAELDKKAEEKRAAQEGPIGDVQKTNFMESEENGEGK